jgi:hypothetical protein
VVGEPITKSPSVRFDLVVQLVEFVPLGNTQMIAQEQTKKPPQVVPRILKLSVVDGLIVPQPAFRALSSAEASKQSCVRIDRRSLRECPHALVRFEVSGAANPVYRNQKVFPKDGLQPCQVCKRPVANPQGKAVNSSIFYCCVAAVDQT